MQYRELGRTGPDISIIDLGTEHLAQTQKPMEEVLRIAVENV